MKTYRVGLVGAGFIGKVHAWGYVNLPFFYQPVPLAARITHVATSHQETAEEARQLLHADVATTDFRAITENPEIDIVHICTPNHRHAEQLLSAMAHGKHLYCDKPLTATLAEAQAIAAALPAYRGTAQMTLQNRFFPATMRARQLLSAGALGEILEFRSVFLHSSNANPKAPLRWKLDGAAGGGVIADLASHNLDLMHWLLGDFAAVTALTQIAFPERPSADDPARRVPVTAEDAVKVLVRLKSGATGTLEASKLATGTENELRFEIYGTKGSLRFDCMNQHYLEYYNAEAPGAPIGGTRGWTRIECGQRYPAPANGFPAVKVVPGWLRTHLACLANFLTDVAAGRPGDPGLAQGIYLQQVMDCCRRAAAEQRWVPVANGLAHE